MPKEAVFTLKLESELPDDFMAEAEAAHHPASQVVREFMRAFVQQQREGRAYDDFLQRKVDLVRTQVRNGLHASNEDVEAEAQRAEQSCCGALPREVPEGPLVRSGKKR